MCREQPIEAEDAKPSTPVHIFFDESGTHDDSPLVLTGAVEVLNMGLVDSSMSELRQRVLVQDHLWQGDDAKRAAFAGRGFHYTEDNASVQGELVSAFAALPFRASVTYSTKTLTLSLEDLLINMFFTQVLNLLRKYAGEHVVLVFEENSNMNAIYSKLVERVHGSFNFDRSRVEVWIGEKPNAGLSLVDYVIGIVGSRLLHYLDLESRSMPYKVAHYDAIQPRISHIFEIDGGRYRSKFGDTLLLRARPESST